MKSPGTTGKQSTAYFAAMAEYGVYLYVFFLFLDAGQTLREIGLYGSLAGWLGLAVLKRDMKMHAVSMWGAMAVFLLSGVTSVLFSIKPEYSLGAAWKDLFPGIAMFAVVSTSFDEARLKRLCGLLASIGLIMLAMGLHGFWMNDFQTYTADNRFLSVDKNKFGLFLGLTLPFFLLFFSRAATVAGRVGWAGVLLWNLGAVVLSRSRGSLGNILVALVVWGSFFTNRKNLKYVAALVVVLALVSAASVPLLPHEVKKKFGETVEDLKTMSLRTTFFWKPALEAVKKRPVFGWGYGSKVYRDPLPFEGTAKPNWELGGGLHSEFVRVLFHQGVLGLAAYLLLLLAGFIVLLKTIRRNRGFVRALAVSLIAVLAGSFVINAVFKGTPFRMLGLILGMAAAVSAIPQEEEGEG